ncbi:MAG: exonuclease SbcCD subunit D [Candidatus Latescibacteria bacterium]|jgi:exonuclease SbcD|nr:exonuclease SbcCD subunit D [Candidatus Latescibacterota bacterium]
MPIKFLHLSDTHIGIENYGRLDPATGLHTRLQDFVRSLRFALELAVEEAVDLVVFCGDAYRSCDPTPTHQREFAALVRTLSDAGIPFVAVTGNHDSPVAFGRASSIDIFGTLRTDGVHIASEPDLITVATRSGPVQVGCLPWLQASRLLSKAPYRGMGQEQTLRALQDLGAEMIQSLAARVDPAYPAILAAHVAAAEASFSGSEQTAVIGRDPVFLTSTLADAAFDYVALGHIHKFQDLNPGGRPPVVYSGSVERVDFGEENEAKGVCLVTIHEGTEASREVEYRFVPTPARPFKTLEVSVAPDSSPTEAILEEIRRHDLNQAVVRIVYENLEPQTEDVDLKAIRDALEGAFLIARIAPRPTRQDHVRRADISEGSGLKDAVHAYVQNRPDLEALESELQDAAARLERELQEGGA